MASVCAINSLKCYTCHNGVYNKARTAGFARAFGARGYRGAPMNQDTGPERVPGLAAEVFGRTALARSRDLTRSLVRGRWSCMNESAFRWFANAR